jgi:CheY-like chemotaxis protein
MKKILFVEDEEALQKTLGELLKQEGYEVISAFDGETGLNLVKSERPDLILLDLFMPKMDGFEVLKRLKADEELKDIPVIVLTQLESIGDVGKAIEAGATTYLVKTQYSLEEILEKVKKALGE